MICATAAGKVQRQRLEGKLGKRAESWRHRIREGDGEGVGKGGGGAASAGHAVPVGDTLVSVCARNSQLILISSQHLADDCSQSQPWHRV